ncbi:hypothetical protein BH09BAC4_BH09BAC4_25380 [soil metagenome]
MKFLSTFIFTLLSVGLAYAQTPKLDSLNRLLRQTTTDTGRININNEKIVLFNQINIDSAMSLGLKTIAQAERIQYKKGEARTRIRLAYTYSVKGDFAAAKATLKLAEAICLSTKDSAQLSKVYGAFGTTYAIQSKYDSSIVFQEKSKAIAERLNDKAQLIIVYSNLGISYDMQSNRPQALQYQQKSLSIAESVGNIKQQAYALVNIANVYTEMGDLKGAEQAFMKGIRLARQESLTNVELYAYSNLVTIYAKMHDTRKAYEMAIKAATLAKEIGDTGIQATALSQAATNLAQQKKFDQAEPLAKQAMTIADASHLPLNIHQAYAAMGNILKQQARCAEAIPFYEKSFAVLKDADLYNAQTGDSYRDLSACYEQVGNYRRALATFKTSAAISDSVRGKENVQKATELTMTYKFDQQQQAAQAEQLKQNELAQARQLALLAGMGLMLVLAAVSFYAYRTKQKANALLEEQKEVLQLQKEELLRQKEELQQQKEELQHTLTKLQTTQTQLIQSEKMASLGELTAGIAHEIQNPLNFVNNFSAISTDLLNEIKEERKKKEERDEELEEEILGDLSGNLAKINHHGGRAASIVKSMLEHSRTSTGEKQLVDLNAVTDEYFRLAFHGLKAKSPDFSCDLVTDFDLSMTKYEVIPQELGRVLLNLFNNAFYAVRQKQQAGVADYQPRVTLSTAQQGQQVEIRVRDNGTGIPQTVLAKIFQPFFTTKPTGQGTGLGLSLSYDIITKGLGGTLTATTQPGEFAEFVITLPIA